MNPRPENLSVIVRPLVQASFLAFIFMAGFVSSGCAATKVIEYDFNAMIQRVPTTARWADTNYSLPLWESADGIDWKLSKHAFVANPGTIRWADGHEEQLTTLECPQLVFDNGEPIPLCCAAANNKSRDGSFNVQIPLKAMR